MSGHTPGPWEIGKAKFTDRGVMYEVIMPDQRITAFDARLIAAAPDLKVALEELFRARGFPERITAAWDKARAALAKCEPGAKS